MLKKIKADGWFNINTYLGNKKKDRTQVTTFKGENLLDQYTLESLYVSGGFARRIVDIVPFEMTRQGFKIQGDPQGLVIAHMETLGLKAKIRELLTWGRLFGGALGVIGADDGGDLTDPLVESRIKSVDFLHIFDRHQVAWDSTQLYSDPKNPKYGTPEFYTLMPKVTTSMSEVGFRVHESRVLRVDGKMLPRRTYTTNNGWGVSVLQSIYAELRYLGGIYGSAANIIEDFVQTVLTVENLSDLLAAGQDDLIKQRLDIIDMSRHVANTIILDSKESYHKQASSVAGLDALMDRFALALAAVSGIPYSFLMGQAPSGLQSTGAADIRMFYDMIKSEQEETLHPILERITHLIMVSKEGGFNGKEPDNWKICFNPLWQSTDEEQASYRKMVAETDAIYLDRGVVDPSEIAISRFGSDVYSSETMLDPEARKPMTTSTSELDAYEAEVQKVRGV